MGVLACARKGCNRIMCDRLSHKYGYICEDCFNELVALGPVVDIEGFMESEKQDQKESYARYNAVFMKGDD